MRKFEFRFHKGDIVRLGKGLGFASPRPKDSVYEKVVVIGHSKQRSGSLTWNSYNVKSLNNPSIIYWLEESFLVKSNRKE